MEPSMDGLNDNDVNSQMSISDEEGVGGTEGSVESENEGVSDSSACVQPVSCIPDAPTEIKPKIGMEFKCEQDAYDFYNGYAQWCGFRVRKDQIRKLKTGQISRQILRCSKAGLRDKKYLELENRKLKSRSITRCLCPASISVNLKKDKDGYQISKFAETHNHKLETPVKAMKRWTRFAKKRPSIATCSSSSQLEDSPLFRCHMLTEQWLYLKNEALKRTSAFVIVKEHLEKAKAAILDLPNDGIVDRPEGEDLRIKTQLPTGAGDNVMLNPSGATHGILSGTLATHSSQTREILDPHIIQTKARTNKRYKSALKQRESTQNINLNEAESGKG